MFVKVKPTHMYFQKTVLTKVDENYIRRVTVEKVTAQEYNRPILLEGTVCVNLGKWIRKELDKSRYIVMKSTAVCNNFL